MKPSPECYSCFLHQALIASRLATRDIRRHHAVQKAIAHLLSRIDLSNNPPLIATTIFRKTYDVLGCPDPYLGVKKEYNSKVKKLFPRLKCLLAGSNDPFATAVRLALAGNIIDFGILERFDLAGTLKETLEIALPASRINGLRRNIRAAKTILYIADNAGEIGFDVFLVQEIKKIAPHCRLFFSVKKSPIINDATFADARCFGLDKLTHLIDTGGNWVGTHPSLCAPHFKEIFNSADLIISKGQANWESLEELHDPRIRFLLKAKCPQVARILNVPLNKVVIA